MSTKTQNTKKTQLEDLSKFFPKGTPKKVLAEVTAAIEADGLAYEQALRRAYMPPEPTPAPMRPRASDRAARTARWARIMTKWLITRSSADRAWEIVNFTGRGGAESRGIVDLLAIRKDHRALGVPRGDYFEMILIQVKGGGASWPNKTDVARLRRVAAQYGARAVVLAAWNQGRRPTFYTLSRKASKRATARESWDLCEDPKRLFA